MPRIERGEQSRTSIESTRLEPTRLGETAIAGRGDAPGLAMVPQIEMLDAFIEDRVEGAETYLGQGIPAIQAFESGKTCPDPALAVRILGAARSLSLTQALDPMEKDGVGFNNADYPVGSIMAASGAVRASAILLLSYSRQSSGYGLSRKDLEWALPDKTLGLPQRAAVNQTLSGLREGARNSIAWAEKERSVVLVGYSLGWEDKRALREVGKQTPQGFEIDKSRLRYVVDKLSASIVEAAGLREIAERAPLPQKEDGGPVLPQMKPVTLTAIELRNGYAISYSDPFSPEGIEVKNAIKKLGGTWDAYAKTWMLSEKASEMLPLLVEDVPRVDLSGYPMKVEDLSDGQRVLAEQFRDGITPVFAEMRGKDLFVRTLSRCDELYNACSHQDGIRWDKGANAYKVDPEALPGLMERLDVHESIDQTALIAFAEEVIRSKAEEVARLEVIIKAGRVQVPELTPTGRELYGHQVEAAEFLLAPNGWGKILGDDMGLGKTAAALVAADLGFHGEKKLVVCPKTPKLNWAKEVKMWLGDEARMRTQVIRDGKDEIEPGMETVIVSYDLAKRMKDKIIEWGPKLAIYDEAHYLKNDSSGRTKQIVGVSKKDEKGRWVRTPGLADYIPTNWALTGTPVKNRQRELFNLLQITKHPLGENFFKFGVRYCNGHQVQINRAGDTRWDFDGFSNLEDLGEKMKPIYLQRKKSEVLDLPPKITSIMPVELSAEAKRAYSKGLKELLAVVRGLPDEDIDGEGTGKAQTPLTKFTEMMHASAVAKIPAAIEHVKSALEEGQKIVVFSPYYDCLDALEAEFKDVCVRLDGSMNDVARETAKERFQEDDRVRVFIGSLHACKESITLTAASESLFVGASPVPGDNDQAADRIYRIGQTGTVNVRFLSAEGTMDEDLFELLAEKQKAIAAFEAAMKEGKAVDPAILAAARRDVSYELLKRLKISARAEERAEKKSAKKLAKEGAA